MLKLKFIGFQGDLNGNQFPLWNVINTPNPSITPNQSTVSQPTWSQLYSIQRIYTHLISDFGIK